MAVNRCSSACRVKRSCSAAARIREFSDQDGCTLMAKRPRPLPNAVACSAIVVANIPHPRNLTDCGIAGPVLRAVTPAGARIRNNERTAKSPIRRQVPTARPAEATLPGRVPARTFCEPAQRQESRQRMTRHRLLGTVDARFGQCNILPIGGKNKLSMFGLRGLGCYGNAPAGRADAHGIDGVLGKKSGRQTSPIEVAARLHSFQFLVEPRDHEIIARSAVLGAVLAFTDDARGRQTALAMLRLPPISGSVRQERTRSEIQLDEAH
jgi:hypothetical protein